MYDEFEYSSEKAREFYIFIKSALHTRLLRRNRRV